MILLTFLFILFASLATFKAILNFDNLKRAKQSEFEWTARWIESEQHRHFAQARLVAFLAVNEIRKGLTGIDCKGGMTGYPGLDPEFSRFAIAKPNGDVYCNSISWPVGKNVSDEAYFKEAIKSFDSGIVTESLNRKSHRYEGMLARAMRDKEGHVMAVILVPMDFSWVKEEVDIARLPASGHLLVISPRGILVAGSKNLSEWVAKPIAEVSLYK
ncbi:MAG TPA: hypothetical protein PLK99_06635, partial [Burkholderiales bacterium]|nr:hypothetical protein [Burkholderiales bacterium]